MKTAGVVFDFYDDPTGMLLKMAFPTPEDLPEIVKEAHILTPEERDVLRDEAYGLVMSNEGKVLRKFACVDPGNTLISALYLIEAAKTLPEEITKVAAARIQEACEEFGLDLPGIQKLAASKKDDGGRASGMSRTRDSMQQPLVGDEADWAARTNLVSVRGGADSGRVIPTANQMKTAAAKPVTKPGFWRRAAKTIPRKTTSSITPEALEYRTRKHLMTKDWNKQVTHGKGQGAKGAREQQLFPQSGFMTPEPKVALASAAPVDVSGAEAGIRFEKKAATNMALHKYPLDSYADIRSAVDFWKTNWAEFDPVERHIFSVKTAAAADAIGLDVPDDMRRYGSQGYAPDVSAHIANRKANVEKKAHAIYDALLEKQASIQPEAFADLLTKADVVTGLNWHWGGAVADPYFATFGGNSAKEKVAFAWTDPTGQTVTAEDLTNLASNKDLLLGSFEKDLVSAFEKDPVTIFESLPDDTKRILANLATGG